MISFWWMDVSLQAIADSLIHHYMRARIIHYWAIIDRSRIHHALRFNSYFMYACMPTTHRSSVFSSWNIFFFCSNELVHVLSKCFHRSLAMLSLIVFFQSVFSILRQFYSGNPPGCFAQLSRSQPNVLVEHRLTLTGQVHRTCSLVYACMFSVGACSIHSLRVICTIPAHLTRTRCGTARVGFDTTSNDPRPGPEKWLRPTLHSEWSTSTLQPHPWLA